MLWYNGRGGNWHGQKLLVPEGMISLGLDIVGGGRLLRPQADDELATIDFVAQFALPIVVVQLRVPENLVTSRFQRQHENLARVIIFALIAYEYVVSLGSIIVGGKIRCHSVKVPASKNMAFGSSAGEAVAD